MTSFATVLCTSEVVGNTMFLQVKSLTKIQITRNKIAYQVKIVWLWNENAPRS